MKTREYQIEQARRLIATGISEDLKEVLYQQYPELKESKDDRIRKAILGITYLDVINPILAKCSITARDIRTYLEKQKEQKPSTPEDIAAAYQMGLAKGHNEQKPAEWSKEDNIMLENTILCLKEYCLTDEISWLKFLPKRFNLQPKQEWSEEDDQYLLICKNALVKYCHSEYWSYPIVSKWLEEHCRVLSQPHWKPSKEQMEMLAMFTNLRCASRREANILESLYNDLKKL